MKVIIAGSRSIKLSTQELDKIVKDSGFEISELVNGDCSSGVDMSALSWAKLREHPTTYFPANWDELGRKAGPLRNREMAIYADALIAVWDGKSNGTKSMLKEMQRLGKPTHLVVID